MAENESFFRKVVRFVANPATDWNELNSRQDDSRELELEKSELKAMIERKRRNDFVRKREFDVLRRIRREGLSPEQAAALEGASRMDDSEARLADAPARADGAVKAKIDEIEQQMVGENFAPSSRRSVPPPPSPSQPAGATGRGSPPADVPMLRDELPARQDRDESLELDRSLYEPTPSYPTSARDHTGAQAPRGLPPLSSSPAPAPALAPVHFAPTTDAATGDMNSPFAVEVSEVMHDPELDEPVISFANADFQQCEEALQRLTGATGVRHQHAETWLVLFDLYRATGQQQRFESLALDYAQQFGWSAPQWYSLPKLVAEAIADEPVLTSTASSRVAGGDIGWVSPPLLDIDAVARLRSQTLQMPLPWIFDWGQLRGIEAEAAMQLSTLFRLWSGQGIEMRWIGGDRLFQVLAEAAPTGVRDADPAFWLTRLDALRLANRADQFDEAAIDYCVTYEVSPPSWEAARCKVHISGQSVSTRTPPMSVVSDVSTSFMESALSEDAATGVEVANVELSGQLVGDISSTLKKLEGELRQATLVNVSCSRLIRVDFIAAGDLLNWVLARRGEGRTVQFAESHRLVALFFGAMGINEHAKVVVRKV
ncbi:MAG: STAS domain-containing protein [Rubrivivax sp.]|nr:STAS domain-containing protein [Rubrivivax sp.]